jgi:hypothetical protein
MPKQTSPTALADRLAALGGVTGAELAAIVRRPVAEVETWIAGDAEPDGEAKILLRLVMDPARAHAAALAVQRVRGSFTRDMRGEAATLADIEPPPYGGGHAGSTGGHPQ